jgi:uncharacterized protein YkuJ
VDMVSLKIYQAKDMISVISRLKAMSEGGIRGELRCW